MPGLGGLGRSPEDFYNSVVDPHRTNIQNVSIAKNIANVNKSWG